MPDAPDFSALAKRLDDAEGYLDLTDLRERRADLEPRIAAPDLWDNPDDARRVTTEYGRINDDIELLEKLRSRLDDARTLWEMASEEGDAASGNEAIKEAESLAHELDELELRSLLGGEHDELDAVCEIHSGEGGTDAQDWAEMLLRMYLRWAERRGFEVELDEVSPGQEAGIQSATFIVRGRHAYGLLLGEKGVHRLYRISPFDSQARRQTSYAALDVVPFMEDVSDEVKIDDKDLRVDTYRSSGAGGQHVNVTDSAVRLTHLPTGIVVACQNERSQLQNKAKAMQILAAKLAERARQERLEEMAKLSGPQGAVSRGGAFIRGYVMAPQQMVKDERTGHETGNVQATLDGELDEFMEAYLRWRRSQDPGR
ncbi:MAG: peptide chain release factor 2 [Actinobacteria bacterium]|nr:peptide chain release factor 2 [Actinomycetota bacterium]